MVEDRVEKARRAEHEFRNAKIEYEYHLNQVRYHLANLARCRVQVNETEHTWCDALEEAGIPDPTDERARVIRMLTLESKRDGKVYTEADAAEVQQRVEQRKSEEYHKIMLEKYRVKSRARA